MHDHNISPTTRTFSLQQEVHTHDHSPSGTGSFIPSELMQMFAQFMQQQFSQHETPVAVEQKKELLTVKEARVELFENAISEYKLYEMLRLGELPAVKVGTKYLLRRSVVIQWMEDQEQRAFEGK